MLHNTPLRPDVTTGCSGLPSGSNEGSAGRKGGGGGRYWRGVCIASRVDGSWWCGVLVVNTVCMVYYKQSSSINNVVTRFLAFLHL